MLLTRILLPVLLAGIVMVPAGLSGAADALTEKPRGQRIFVMGHSFHMPIAQPLDQMAQAAGIDGSKIAGTQGIGGSSVTQH